MTVFRIAGISGVGNGDTTRSAESTSSTIDDKP
jgi:hypothetical protein